MLPDIHIHHDLMAHYESDAGKVDKQIEALQQAHARLTALAMHERHLIDLLLLVDIAPLPEVT
jgi:hypothetical protein